MLCRRPSAFLSRRLVILLRSPITLTKTYNYLSASKDSVIPKPRMSASDAKVLSTAPLEDKDAKWTRLVLTKYSDPTGKERTWESAERRTRPSTSTIDGVGILALLQQPDGSTPHLLLQKQFRPPINAVCIEVPAGLVDDGETPEEAAVRELKEETGYVGTLDESSPIMFNGKALDPGGYLMWKNPGFTNTNLRMIHLTIDMSNPANKPENLKPELEENEYIEVFTVPIDRLWEECKKLEKQGFAIDARVGTLAEGVEVAKKLGLGGK